jgi:hypothetical protein
MSRNRIVLMAITLILAAVSFGFTSRPTTGIITTKEGTPFPRCPLGWKWEKVREGHKLGILCIRPTDPPGISNNGTPLIQGNLATVKVTPELAAALALFEQPAGTVVTNVSGLYTGTIPPYYEVTLVDGNYVRTVYIDARNGNILPPQFNHPYVPSGNIFYPRR